MMKRKDKEIPRRLEKREIKIKSTWPMASFRPFSIVW
jgi:hypothetical protein